MEITPTSTGTSKWNPDFLRSVDTALEELTIAKEKALSERSEAIEAVRKAEDELQYVLVEWEGIPEPAADVIRGVLTEARAIQQIMEDRTYKGVAPDTLTGRLLDAIKGLEALTEF